MKIFILSNLDSIRIIFPARVTRPTLIFCLPFAFRPGLWAPWRLRAFLVLTLFFFVIVAQPSPSRHSYHCLQLSKQAASRQVLAANAIGGTKLSKWDIIRNTPHPSQYGPSRQGYRDVVADGARQPVVGSTRGTTFDVNAADPTPEIFSKPPGPASLLALPPNSQNRPQSVIRPSHAAGGMIGNYANKHQLSLESSAKKSGGIPNRPLGKNGATTSDPRQLYQSSLTRLNSSNSSFSPSPSRPRAVFIGFRNVGNSCYMGATLRALVSLKSFLSDLGHSRLFSIEGIPADSFYTNFLALVDVATQKDRTREIDPTPLKKALGKHFQAFAGSQQQDAHEFFIECIGQIEADLYPHLRVQRAKTVQKLLSDIVDNKKSSQSPSSSSGKRSSTKRVRVIPDDDEEGAQQQQSDARPEPEKLNMTQQRAILQKLFDEGDMTQFETMFCPSKRNFGGVMETRLVCQACGAERCSRELIRDISVEVYDREELCQMILRFA